MRRTGRRTVGVVWIVALKILSTGSADAEVNDSHNTDEPGTGIEWFWIPFPNHSPETDWGLTFAAIAGLEIADGAPSSVIMTASWTRNEQQSLAADAALNIGSDWRVSGRVALEDWPTHYYGLGSNTRTEDEELYDARNTELTASVQRNVADRFWIGPQIVWRDHRAIPRPARDIHSGRTALPDPGTSRRCRVRRRR